MESPGRTGVGEDGDGEEAEGERRGAVAAVAAAGEVVPSLPAAGGEETSDDGENEAPPGAAPVLFTGGGEGEGEPKGDPEEGEPAPPGLALAEGGRGLANPFVPEKDDDEPSTGDGAGLEGEPANGPATPLAGERVGAGPPGDAKEEEGGLKGACDVADGNGRPVAAAEGGGREKDGEKEETGVAEEEERAAEAEEEEPRDGESESSEPSGPPPPGRFRLLTRFFRASSSLAFLASSLFCASSIFKLK